MRIHSRPAPGPHICGGAGSISLHFPVPCFVGCLTHAPLEARASLRPSASGAFSSDHFILTFQEEKGFLLGEHCVFYFSRVARKLGCQC